LALEIEGTRSLPDLSQREVDEIKRHHAQRAVRE
jgi:hypothetical protein